MRTIDHHKIPGADTAIDIATTDAEGSGGAYHRYLVTGLDLSRNASLGQFDGDNALGQLVILFQNGPVPANGVNGVTTETLLAICKDRLECFQAGPFNCADNAIALNGINQALDVLKQRTRDRIARNVEGKETK